MASPSDIIKDPYVFEFLGIPENKPIMESELEKALVQQIEKFLLELGRGFMFVGTQQRVTLNNIHYYVDMVFYNNIFASRYTYVIPNKEELIAQVKAVLREWHKPEANGATEK